jgi:ataxin-10
VVLAYCATDFENPLCREFALMCVRNLCEGNLENQRLIESLQPQQVLQDDALLERGIRIDIDPLSGRFNFSQTSLSEEQKSAPTPPPPRETHDS